MIKENIIRIKKDDFDELIGRMINYSYFLNDVVNDTVDKTGLYEWKMHHDKFTLKMIKKIKDKRRLKKIFDNYDCDNHFQEHLKQDKNK